MNFLNTFFGWWRSGRALGDSSGQQSGLPANSLVQDVPTTTVDGALQISAVWACVSLIAKTIASLPIMVYETKNGQRELARDSSLWQLLHESPNSRMTPMEFWIAILLNLLLRGNGYARIERRADGEAYALWPMPADQVQMQILPDGSIVYVYRIDNDVAVLAAENVLHLKEMGNGTIGLSRLDYMKATVNEAANAQNAANKLFANGGKPTGVLMVDHVLSKEQRQAVQENFAGMANGTTSRLYVLEASMKYQQINLSPEDMQLLATRQYGVQELGRWFGVPSILINQTEGTTTLGSSSGEIIESFHKLILRPGIVNLEQALRKRVMTPGQRARYTAEYNLDALLRASLKDRMEIYAKAVQNGIKVRNECRQLENDPPLPGGDVLTVQSNLVPIELLGKVKGTGNAGTQDTIAQ
jgi:HK97 family phage portal protein